MNNQTNNKKMLIIISVALIAVIAVAALLYNIFAKSSDNKSTKLHAFGSEKNTKTESIENSKTENEKVDENNAQTDAEKSEQSDKIGMEYAPDFTVEDLSGKKHKLSDFRGKPVILNFWASWCGPCKMEMPDFEELYNEYGDKIHFLMVNMTDGYQETKEKATAHIDSEGYTFPVYYDTNMEAAYAYGVSSIPATYFIDSEGYPVVYGVGALDKETLLTGIEMFPEFK